MATSLDNNYVPPATFGRVKSMARECFATSGEAIEHARKLLLKGSAARYRNVAGNHIVTELIYVDV